MQDRSHHIMIVDDDELVRFTLKEYLTEEGFHVSEANSASAARDLFEREKVDVILLDVRMPGEGGLSLTRDIRAKSDVPIILISGKGEDVRLTRGEFHLLAAFVNSHNRVLDRDHLLDMVSGRDWAPNDRTIDVMVRQLRKKIEDDPDNPKIFVTVHGVGYNFAPDV